MSFLQWQDVNLSQQRSSQAATPVLPHSLIKVNGHSKSQAPLTQWWCDGAADSGSLSELCGTLLPKRCSWAGRRASWVSLTIIRLLVQDLISPYSRKGQLCILRKYKSKAIAGSRRTVIAMKVKKRLWKDLMKMDITKNWIKEFFFLHFPS